MRANPRPSADAVWEQLWDEAAYQFKTQNWKTGDLQEFGIDRYLHEKVLMHKTLACGLAAQIGNKLSANESAARTYPEKDAGVDFRAIMMSAFDADASICEKVAMDIARFKVVDPAVESLLGVYLNFKGLHAVAAQRDTFVEMCLPKVRMLDPYVAFCSGIKGRSQILNRVK